MKTFGFTQIKEDIGSTHIGILETYTTSFKSKNHQLESRAWLAKSENMIYQWHYVLGKELLEVFVNEGDCWMINSTKDLTVHNGADVRTDTQSEEETMQRHWIIETVD